MSTIHDVARRCGYSVATVSNVLNGKSGKVSPATADAVMQAVRELRYRPKARTRRTPGRLHNVGLLFGNLMRDPFAIHGYMQDVLTAVTEAALTAGCTVSVQAEHIYEAGAVSLRHDFDGRFDGLIVASSDPESELLELLLTRGMPVVSIGSPLNMPSIPLIDIDNVEAGRVATRRLIELGHTRICYIGTEVSVMADRQRSQGYMEAMSEAGLAVQVERISHMRGDPLPVRHMTEVLGRTDAPTAFFCFTDTSAVACALAAKSLGMQVPRDISLIGFDGLSEGATFDPPLDSFTQPMRQMAIEAISVLRSMATDPNARPESSLFQAKLVEQGSTAPAPDHSRRTASPTEVAR